MIRPPGVFAPFLLLGLLTACTSSSASPTSVPSAPTVKPAALTVGLVTDTGGLHDRSYNHLAYLGLKESASRWGTHYRVLQSRTADDYVPYLNRFVTDHAGLIVAIGFSMRSAVYQVAVAHPDVRFALVDATPLDSGDSPHPLSNVSDLYFKEEESGYLVGVIAGLMERERVGKAVRGSIGYLGGAVIPQVTRYLAGYVAGARKVDPSVKITGDYAPSFYDEKAGTQIGDRQIGLGSDILFQVAARTGVGYLGAAQQHGVYGIGVDADQSYLGPVVITSAVKKVDVAVRLTVGSVIDGSFSGGDHRYGLKEGATGFAPPSSTVPRDVVAQASAYARKIARGEIVPPTETPQA